MTETGREEEWDVMWWEGMGRDGKGWEGRKGMGWRGMGSSLGTNGNNE